jgi:spore coat protein U-like protein
MITEMADRLRSTRQRKTPISAGVSLLALLLCLSPAPGLPATATATLAITVSVLATCQISATALTFPAYSGAMSDASSTISLTCTKSTAYNVGLSAGTAAGASVTNRRMTGTGGVQLPYTLYSDSGRTVNWGNTVGSDTMTGTGNGSAQALTVYGRLVAGQFVTPGNYSDTIIATVTY